jgi:hypothetical protein
MPCDFHFNLIGQGATYHRMLDPGYSLDLTPAGIERNAQNALATIDGENFEHALGRNIMVPIHGDLVRMHERHFMRGQQKIGNRISDTGRGETRSRPESDASVRPPRFAAEFSTLDFERLLPPKILRLFVREDFLWESVRVHGS